MNHTPNTLIGEALSKPLKILINKKDAILKLSTHKHVSFLSIEKQLFNTKRHLK